jgi:hypothetical protein
MKKKYLLIQLITVFIASALSLLSMADDGDSDEDQDIDFNGSDCISIRSIRDYTPLDGRTLLIWGGVSRPYFVRLSSSSYDLKMAYAMSVDSRDDRLCPYGGDGLSFGSFRQTTVRVRSITRISKEQAEELLVRYGVRKTDEPRIPEPKEVEGPEVQELD